MSPARDRTASPTTVADRRAGGLGRVVGNVQQSQPGRQVRASHVRVVPEHRRAHDQGDIVPGELVAQRAHRERQPAHVLRVVFGNGARSDDGPAQTGAFSVSASATAVPTRFPARWPRRRSAPGQTRAG